MANTKFLRGATLDGIGDLVDDTAGVDLLGLPSFTTLLVWTMNSMYRVVVTQWPEVYVQGGAFFPDPTLARVDGVCFGGNCLRVGWIGPACAAWRGTFARIRKRATPRIRGAAVVDSAAAAIRVRPSRAAGTAPRSAGSRATSCRRSASPCTSACCLST